ncbi:hypothetical protein P9D43_29835 [Neobacillus niacini]|uniref:hypothetical protein n=1 Tax=Neobacillus niacini TaxID=86668 RepID=UPI00052FD4EB|nr:hypothetical protein [Neobacillus niacini]KGM45698.1 hypothetical protein NP83_04655 [Neobacillus niacini]MEC1526192.1 hypothetical protein [Neobacillus niacini]
MENKSGLLKRADMPTEGGDGPGTGEHTSGGATGHGGTNPGDIHEPIEHDGSPNTSATPPEFWNKKKGNKYS